MCGQFRFDVHDNVATFDGQVDACCLPTMEITAASGDLADQLRTHMTGLLRTYLQHLEYQTGEGAGDGKGAGRWRVRRLPHPGQHLRRRPRPRVAHARIHMGRRDQA